MNNTQQIKKAPETLGRMAAALWETPECPFDITSKEASEWSNGLIDGRHAMSYNTRNMVQAGATCQFLSEAVSAGIAMALAKSILHLAGESAILFRLGFIMSAHGCPVPTMTVDGWRRLAAVVNKTMKGQLKPEFREGETWLESIASIEAADFVAQIIGHTAPEDAKHLTFEVDVAKILGWMGAPSEIYAGKIPKDIGV